jgi:hypothetical protein
VLKLVPRAKAEGKNIFKGRVVYKIKVNPPDNLNPKPTIEILGIALL